MDFIQVGVAYSVHCLSTDWTTEVRSPTRSKVFLVQPLLTDWLCGPPVLLPFRRLPAEVVFKKEILMKSYTSFLVSKYINFLVLIPSLSTSKSCSNSIKFCKSILQYRQNHQLCGSILESYTCGHGTKTNSSAAMMLFHLHYTKEYCTKDLFFVTVFYLTSRGPIANGASVDPTSEHFSSDCRKSKGTISGYIPML